MYVCRKIRKAQRHSFQVADFMATACSSCRRLCFSISYLSRKRKLSDTLWALVEAGKGQSSNIGFFCLSLVYQVPAELSMFNCTVFPVPIARLLLNSFGMSAKGSECSMPRRCLVCFVPIFLSKAPFMFSLAHLYFSSTAFSALCVPS